MKVDGDILTITVNLKERYGRSKSGKTEIIATTGGNVSSPSNPDIKIGLNVYSK
jgi:hypothetical protein